MRSIVLAILFASLLPTAGVAQTMSPTTPAPEPQAVPPAARGADNLAGITRDRFVQRAEDRAGRAAGRRFDEIDTDHDGLLSPDEIRAYRATHGRNKGGAPATGTPE